MSRGRKVKRHACSVTGTQQYGRMESSGMSASPANGTERIVVADKAGERETNASERLAVPEAAGRRETEEPCPTETAEGMGARETNVPEERSAAVRRGAARKRGQEKAADRGRHRGTTGGCRGAAFFTCERG